MLGKLTASIVLRRIELLVVVPLLFATACGRSDAPFRQTRYDSGWQTFEGTWTATGTRRTLRLGADDRAAIFELTGTVLLSGAQRPALGFRAQAIGFSDSRAGMQGRCVWTDERGDMVYSELKALAALRGGFHDVLATYLILALVYFSARDERSHWKSSRRSARVRKRLLLPTLRNLVLLAPAY